jgi:predicted GIY-YIG superfamily endonuclease
MLARLQQVCNQEPFEVELNNFYIYVLLDPTTHEVRYIGKSKNINKRLATHISALYKHTHKENWIRSLKLQHQTPIILAIWSADNEQTIIKNEMEFIELAKLLKINLTNGTNGGVGSSGRIVSPETREKMRQAQLGKKLSEETKKKISEKLKGNKYSLGVKHTQETKEKIIKSTTGLKRSEETKHKISISKIGSKNPFYGKKHTEETKEKIRKAMLGNNHKNRRLVA